MLDILYDRLGITFKIRLMVMTLAVALTFSFMWAYRYWTAPVVPVFPDVENADGTIDYTLVGTEFMDPGRRLVAYNKLVVRLPKHIKVTRPLAEGGSVSSGGVSLSYPKNPNVAIMMQLDWRFLADGKTDLTDDAANPALELDRLLLSIGERPESLVSDMMEAFWKNCKLLESKQDGFVKYVPVNNDGGWCYRVMSEYSRLALLSDGQVLAFVGCPQDTPRPRDLCTTTIFYRSYRFTAWFPARFVAEFPQAYRSLITIVDNSIINQSRTALE
jgi:hypothetical protein